MPIFLKCGIADSTKEAKTIEVITTKAKSRKTHSNITDKMTTTARIMVLVEIEIVVI